MLHTKTKKVMAGYVCLLYCMYRWMVLDKNKKSNQTNEPIKIMKSIKSKINQNQI